MYQINYLPWRQTRLRKKILIWLYQTLFLVTLTFIILGYYTYCLGQKQYAMTEQQHQTQQQENRLVKQLEVYQQQKQQTHLRYQHYSLYYQNWLRYLHYIRIFQTIEAYLPSSVWVNHYSTINNHLSLNLILPNKQPLSFIADFKNHPFLSFLTLDYLQQSKTHPSYTEVHLNGDLEKRDLWNIEDKEE
ncbi:fimbrial assembly protein [Proteus sp. FME41]|uniref:fimbrial assembly protein n=1 Tax=Proteus sp. FME41 TaxID=2742608 RepID=UPI00186629A8|nr:fimbrial assembly protein [Proteus sp. FME41]